MPAKKRVRKAPAKKTAVKKAPAKKTVAKKAPAKKTTNKTFLVSTDSSGNIKKVQQVK